MKFIGTVAILCAVLSLCAATSEPLPPISPLFWPSSQGKSSSSNLPEYPPRFSFSMDVSTERETETYVLAYDSWRGRHAVHYPDGTYLVVNQEFEWSARLDSNGRCWHWEDCPINYPTLPEGTVELGYFENCQLPNGDQVHCQVLNFYAEENGIDYIWYWYNQFPVREFVFYDQEDYPMRDIKFYDYSTQPEDELYELDEVCSGPPSYPEEVRSYMTNFTVTQSDPESSQQTAYGYIARSVNSHASYTKQFHFYDPNSDEWVYSWLLSDFGNHVTRDYYGNLDTCILHRETTEPGPVVTFTPHHTFIAVKDCPNNSMERCAVYEAQITDTVKETVYWQDIWNNPDRRERFDHELETYIVWDYPGFASVEPPAWSFDIIPECTNILSEPSVN